MTSTAPTYLVITPCRNEAEFARRTLDSVAGQSVLPTQWVIVDDGSTDETPQILREYADRFPFITIIRVPDRGKRSVGPGVVEAFYAGYESVESSNFDYVCKLDLDVELPSNYFETLILRMEANPRLGTCSGKPYNVGPKGRLVGERVGGEMSVGMTKFYRTACFQQIGGFVRAVMWDGIDCHRCRMLGWEACSWDDLHFLHLRPMGSSQGNIWVGRMRHGRGQYFMGTSLLYMTASALYRLSSRPWVTGSLGMWLGYVTAMIRREPRYEDKEFRRFLRRYQLDCLLRGKRRATQSTTHRLAGRWNTPGTVEDRIG